MLSLGSQTGPTNHECQVNTPSEMSESNKMRIKINDTDLTMCIITGIAPLSGKSGKRHTVPTSQISCSDGQHPARSYATSHSTEARPGRSSPEAATLTSPLCPFQRPEPGARNTAYRRPPGIMPAHRLS